MQSTRFSLSIFLLATLLLRPAPARQQEGGAVLRRAPGAPAELPAEEIQSADEVFDKIESACAGGDPNQFSPLLAQKIYLNLFTGENGHFSSNQAYFILRKFFAEHRVLSCTLPTRSIHTSVPYATGRIQYLSRGVRNTALIYAALSRTDERWLLTQLTISTRP